MKHAIIITGFNNWGKSTLISKLFSQRQRFDKRQHPHKLPGGSDLFSVFHPSNDDIKKERWLENIQDHYECQINLVNGPLKKNINLITSLCPSKEPDNDFTDILSHKWFKQFNKIYIFLIVWKWDCHAQLITHDIKKHLRVRRSTLRRIKFITISGEEEEEKLEQIRNELKKIFL